MDPAWIVALVSLATLMAGLIAWSLRWAWKLASRLSRFIDDYFGEPSVPGRPERPGVMLRLENLERKVESVNSQVQFNTGHSMRDVVQQTASDVSHVKEAVKRLSSRVDQLGGKP